MSQQFCRQFWIWKETVWTIWAQMNHTTRQRYLIFDKVHFIVCSPSGDLSTKSAIFCFNIFWCQTVCTSHSLSLLSDKLVAGISDIWNVTRILSTLGFPAWAEQYLYSILGAFISFFIIGQIFVLWEFARPIRVMSLGAHNRKKLSIYQQCLFPLIYVLIQN